MSCNPPNAGIFFVEPSAFMAKAERSILRLTVPLLRTYSSLHIRTHPHVKFVEPRATASSLPSVVFREIDDHSRLLWRRSYFLDVSIAISVFTLAFDRGCCRTGSGSGVIPALLLDGDAACSAAGPKLRLCLLAMWGEQEEG